MPTLSLAIVSGSQLLLESKLSLGLACRALARDGSAVSPISATEHG